MNLLRAVLSPAWPEPESGEDSPVLLLLHGYGSNEHDLASLAPSLPDGVEWASLRAPLDMDFGGAMWFPLDPPTEPDSVAIAAATDAIWAWVDAHVPTQAPVVPVGFSQGGMMAIELLRTRPERVAVAVVLAGFTTIADRPGDAILAASRPPVFWGRGAADAVVLPEELDRLRAWLPVHATLTEGVYPGLGHGINEDEMDDVRAFLATCMK